jgi:2-octaprenyl-6-methoxyphenol hydroxylase
MLDMVITDSKADSAMRPTFLTFDGEVTPGEPFAHMIENGSMIAALLDKARAEGVDLRPVAFTRYAHEGPRLSLTLSDGASLSARLLVAADGARSAIREQAGIARVGWDYDQAGIVTTVAHERDHHGRAEEHFLPPGPFAILPLKGKRSSIVWTETKAEAARLVALPDAEFLAELEKRFGLHLGDLSLAGPRRAYPLGLHVARSFIADRIALIGDAAHVIHPIAGQGLNMGLRDVAALAEAVVDAARLGIDVGAATVLERYQRWRRFDTMAMGVATDGLNRLFSNNSDVLRLVRDVGLGLVDRMPQLKNFFIREAAGLTGDVPKLLRGEAL